MERGSGIASKTGGVLVALLFGVGFGAAGAYGVASLASQLRGWWQARDWVAVPAIVMAVELQEHYDDGTTYRVAARYAYEYGGRHHEGTRVGFNTGYDNV